MSIQAKANVRFYHRPYSREEVPVEIWTSATTPNNEVTEVSVDLVREYERPSKRFNGGNEFIRERLCITLEPDDALDLAGQILSYFDDRKKKVRK